YLMFDVLRRNRLRRRPRATAALRVPPHLTGVVNCVGEGNTFIYGYEARDEGGNLSESCRPDNLRPRSVQPLLSAGALPDKSDCARAEQRQREGLAEGQLQECDASLWR